MAGAAGDLRQLRREPRGAGESFDPSLWRRAPRIPGTDRPHSGVEIRITRSTRFVTITARMAVRAFVLILAVSLLAGAPACRCEPHAPLKARKPSCGHCPKESDPKNDPGRHTPCCCVHPSGDRAAEERVSLVERSSMPIDGDLGAGALPSTPFRESIELGVADRSSPWRPGLPLFILLERLAI